MTDSGGRPAGSAYEQAVAYINQGAALPAMLLLDAGSAVWRVLSSSAVEEDLQPYDDVQPILEALRHKGIRVALVGRVASVPAAQSSLQQLHLDPLLAAVELASGEDAVSLPQQMQALKQATGVSFDSMLMVSSQVQVLREAGRLGMAAVRAREGGLTVAVLKDGLAAFRSKQLDDRGFSK